MERGRLGEELLALLAELVAIPSHYPPGDTSRVAAFCSSILKPYKTEIVGKGNLVARLGTGKPSIVLNAHADTVDVGDRAAWRTDPFKATLIDGRVYGLGACNCKSAMAVHLWLAREIARRGGPQRGELVFTFVGDEENLGAEGLAFLRKTSAVKPDVLVVAAQTRNRLVLEERGVMWVKVVARGKAAHAGAPHTGESAILKMHAVISEIQKRFVPKRSLSGHESTLSIGKIRGGENTNVVPDYCEIEIDRRILPEDDFEVEFAAIKELASGADEVQLLTGTPGFSAREHGAGARAFAEAIRKVTGKAGERLNAVGASDARYFARDGIEILVTGPGGGADSHIANESVPLDELVDAALIHLAAVERLLGSP
jgi:acetylornithine deacetylase/succinyl-diaminopimelate desuccinylase-like protein